MNTFNRMPFNTADMPVSTALASLRNYSITASTTQKMAGCEFALSCLSALASAKSGSNIIRFRSVELVAVKWACLADATAAVVVLAACYVHK